jgi:hypothetical protein
MTSRKSAARLCCALLCLLAGTRALATDDLFSHPSTARDLIGTLLAGPAQRLSQARQLRGRFIHRKFLTEVPAPLVARGEFLFARDLGIYWHTQAPFDSEFILTPSGMLERDEGAESVRLRASEQPTVRVAAEIFLALFALDLDTLGRNFDMYGHQEGRTWRLGLRPKTAALRAVLQQVVVQGEQQVESIELRDAGGDRTEIVLHDVHTSADDPSADERRRFEQ